jgi:hypothetical protein
MMSDETSTGSDRPPPKKKQKRQPIKNVLYQRSPQEEALRQQREQLRAAQRLMCPNTPDLCKNAGAVVRGVNAIKNGLGESCCMCCGSVLAQWRKIKRRWFCRIEDCEYHDYNTPFITSAKETATPIYVVEKQGKILLAQCPRWHGFNLVPATPHGFPPWVNLADLKDRASSPYSRKLSEDE